MNPLGEAPTGTGDGVRTRRAGSALPCGFWGFAVVKKPKICDPLRRESASGGRGSGRATRVRDDALELDSFRGRLRSG